jgi:hypothetical protein
MVGTRAICGELSHTITVNPKEETDVIQKKSYWKVCGDQLSCLATVEKHAIRKVPIRIRVLHKATLPKPES